MINHAIVIGVERLREGAEHTLSHVYAVAVSILSLYQICILKFPVHYRPKSTAIEKEKSQSPLIAPENVVNVGVKAGKKDKLPKHSIQQTDGAKYMSYLKVSYTFVWLNVHLSFM